MHRARVSVPPEAIRIEDEVWQEAFRETIRPRARPQLRSLDGDLRSLDGGRTARLGAPRRVSAPTNKASTRPRASIQAPIQAPIETPIQAPVAEAPDSAWGPADRPDRRTVTITGRGAERNLPWPSEAARRRSARRLHERAGFRPDRFAMWALFLGLLLLLVAATSAH